MKNIYKANYGKFPIRFIFKDNEVFVSKDDLLVAFCSFSPDGYDFFWEKIFKDEHSLFSDYHDRKLTKVDVDTVGVSFNFQMVGNMLHNVSCLHDANNLELRDIAFKINTFMLWYCDILSAVNDHFGVSLTDMLQTVKKRLDRMNPPYLINIYKDNDIWIGECDELGLVTEAISYDELTDKVWEIAPDLYECNGLGNSSDNIRLSFVQQQSAEERDVM